MFLFTVFAYLLTTMFSNIAMAKADEVFMVGGADIASIPGAPNGAYMPAIFQGELCKNGNHCTVVPFGGGAGVLTAPHNPTLLDQSVADATDGLVQAIKNTPGPKIAVAISAGAPVVEEAARRLQNDPNGPSSNEFSVILAGPIDEGIGKLVPDGTYLNSIGYTVKDREPTKYSTTIVTQEYDGLSTVPPDPSAHPLAAANTAVGGLYAHVGYFTANLADPNNVATQEGNITHIVMPNNGEPPLVEALNDFGQPLLADAIREPLQADLDAVKQMPQGDMPPVEMAPEMVDQMLTNVSPMFAQGIEQQTDNLVNQLAPIFAQDSEMMQYIPPALLEDIPATMQNPTAAQVNYQEPVQDNSPAPAPDEQLSVVQDMSANVIPVSADSAPTVASDQAPVQDNGQTSVVVDFAVNIVPSGMSDVVLAA